MTRKPQLRTPVIAVSLAVLFWSVSGFDMPRWLTTCFYSATFISIAVFLYSFGMHLAYSIAMRMHEFQQAGVSGQTNVLDKWIELNNSIRAMDSDQLHYAMKMRPVMQIVPGHHTKPIKTLILENGVQASWEFVTEFCELSQGEYLVEVRRWSEGSAWHKWADALTLSFTRNGYAIDPAGLHSAKWVNKDARDEAFYSIGYLEE